MIALRDQELLRQRFQRDLTSRVRIDYFTQKETSLFVPGRQPCPFCEDCRTLMEEIGSLSERIALTVHDFQDSAPVANDLGVDKVPAIVIRGQTNRSLRFFGLPSANQFPVLIEALIESSAGKVDLKPETVKQLRKLKTDVRLQVMVTPTCQHSPAVSRLVFKLALQSVRIKVDVIEAVEFPELATRHNLRATPTVFIGDQLAVPGVTDETTLMQDIMRVAEGKAFTSQTRTSNATVFVHPNEQRQQQDPNEPQRFGSSGLVLPR